jgi:hypothetical protein
MFIDQPINSSSIQSTSFNDSSTSIGMLAVKIYGFGGLAFMIGTVLSALGLWVWTVVIKREWANSPPDLELHPEVSIYLLCFDILFSY